MDGERWRHVKDLFNAAIACQPEERASLLARMCNGDEELRRQAQRLLDAHEQSGDFIESPAFEAAPELLIDDADALIGHRLGHYRIESVLGVGGMGVVYLAMDEQLGRKVGLKLLPRSLVADAAHLERLKREARTASALNHPNIVTIHEIGHANATHYIATEFIDGVTLRERIRRGPLPPNEALDIASQVASALCVAHRAGIVHRDIKPENIMLRSDGYVKVLDFGIAKFTPPATAASPTLAQLSATTQAGIILGTTRYMSPEQARSQPVDARSDVWSLGVVLYEMLAGRAPFEGDTPTDVMAAVLMKEPVALDHCALALPEKFQRVVVKALQKEKEARYQSASELLDDLRRVKQELDAQEKSGTSTGVSPMDGTRARQANERNLLAELKRRNVYKVAVAYAVVGWLVMQVAATVVPALHLPDTITTTVVVLILLGFPIALLLAWAFELTPQGIKRSKAVGPEQSMTRRAGGALNFIVLGALLLVIALFVWERRQAKHPSRGETFDKSIAVLPFENRSDDKANAYFADGVQDEILTRLSKIADLNVIANTSTQHYTSAPENVPEIARQLGVVHILKGSVQKSGDSVRVNVQLIRAASDSRLWAETFDRKLTDLFSVQSEVARAIAEQLRAKMTGQEEQVIAAKSTNNPEAYDAYLRGLAYAVKTARSSANDVAAQKYLREAVRLDPKFALSWAMLSYVDSSGYVSLSLQPTNELREEARLAAESALKLEPNLGEALVANGYYHYACLKDYDTAERYFDQARRFLPNSSLIPETLAYVARRRGQWDRSESYFNGAERIDPLNVKLLSQHALSYIAQRRFSEALRRVDQILNITPDDSYPIALKASIAQLEGDLPRAAAILAPLHPDADNTPVLETQAYQAILERRPEQLIARLKEVLAAPDPTLGYNIGGLRFYLGWAQEVAGDHAAAQESWQQARSELEPLLKEQSRNYLLVSALAFSEMGLGDKAAALQLAEFTMAGNPIEKDAVMGARPLEIFARVAAGTGETDRAIAAIEKLLSIPYGGLMERQLPLTPALLRLDPMFDPLRDDPRFQKLVGSNATKNASAPPAGGQQITSDTSLPTSLGQKSIAVLPFQNLSKDEENAFFADAVQDQILTDLAKVADLKVISRTSVIQYKQSGTRNLREIAQQLGVAHVLEGTVQRAANRVRVNAQLINAQTDTHVWGETYDRDLADVFAIQSDIAKTIADQLQAKLSPREKAAIEKPPTSDLTAFDLYIRAKTLDDSVSYSAATKEILLQAADLLDQAVARDSSFFDAYCWLVRTHGSLYIYGFDHSPERLALAETALTAAFRLRPDAGEAHLARARHLYLGYLDYENALAEVEIARKTLANDPRIFELTGYIRRRQGHLDEGVQNLERALTLDPRNLLILEQISLSYEKLRRYAEMGALLDRALAIKPNDAASQVARGLVDFEWKADTRRLHQTIDSVRKMNSKALPEVADNWFYCALGERDPAGAEAALVALGDGYFGADAPLFHRQFGEGLIGRMTNDKDKARIAFTAARAEQEKIVQAEPDYGPALCVLAIIDAGLGRKEEALREGRRALELTPVAKDALHGPNVIGGFAVIAAWVGEKDLACEQLETNIRLRGYGLTSYGQLKLSPFWDPLRGQPRFEKIVASLAPKDTSPLPK